MSLQRIKIAQGCLKHVETHTTIFLFCRYGFVVYADPSVTDIACQGLNGLKMGDRVLTVRRATEVIHTLSVRRCCSNHKIC